MFVFLGLAFILGSLIWDRALRHRRRGRAWPSIARIGRLDPRRIDFVSFNESGWLGLEGGAGWPFRREVAPRRHVSGERPCPKHAQGCCKSDGTDSHKESLGGAMHLSGRGLPLEAEYASPLPLRNGVKASPKAAQEARSNLQRPQKKSSQERERGTAPGRRSAWGAEPRWALPTCQKAMNISIFIELGGRLSGCTSGTESR